MPPKSKPRPKAVTPKRKITRKANAMFNAAQNKSEDELMHERGYITAGTAALILRRDISRVYFFMDAGEIDGERIGRKRYVKWRSLVSYMERAGTIGLYGIDPKKMPENESFYEAQATKRAPAKKGRR